MTDQPAPGSVTDTPSAEDVSEPATRFCRDCGHVVGVRYAIEGADDWRCGASDSIMGRDLVTGSLSYRYGCREARANSEACGADGKWYEEYKAPIRGEYTRPGKAAVNVDDMLSELGSL